ncbi:MAG: hypothetical protein WAK11_12110 [Candidatus Cybelea sp.]
MKSIEIAAVAVLLMAGCGGRANPLPEGSTYASSAVAPALTAFGLADGTSILKLDKKQVVIGSTIDPKYHQLNPYGLAVASKTSGHLTKAISSSATSTINRTCKARDLRLSRCIPHQARKRG